MVSADFVDSPAMPTKPVGLYCTQISGVEIGIHLD